MVLGAVWCPRDKAREVAERIREIKQKHGLGRDFESKWTKVSPGGLRFYLDLLDYFFDDDDLHFRALVVTDKGKLRHADFQQDHDEWYYKMYFSLLKVLLDPQHRYRIYLDIKDTRGAEKVRKLEDVLRNAHYDFDRKLLESVQTVRSHEIELIQVTDLLTGIMSYANRGLETSPAKSALVERAKSRSKYTLLKTTLYREQKFNLFQWEPREK